MGTARQPPPGEGESLRTVIIALVANAGIAAAKFVAALLTRSSAMLAEAIHATADTGNQVLLLLANRLARRPADESHPLGHGREAYFWALVAALGMFLTGALLAVRQGIMELFHPVRVSSPLAAYVVLGISFCLDGVSLMRAYRQLKKEATRLDLEFLEHFDRSSDPVGRAVFAEDAVAMVGNLIAFAGIVLDQVSGSAIPDAAAALIIGLCLAVVALDLDATESRFPRGAAGLRGGQGRASPLDRAPAGRHGRRRALGDLRRAPAALGGGAHPDRRRARRPGDEAPPARDRGRRSRRSRRRSSASTWFRAEGASP